MFCGKCGNNVPDGAVVCPACGSPTGAAPAPGAKKPNKNLIAGIVGVVVVIALVIVLISSCGGNDPESMAIDFVEAMCDGNGEDVWDACNMDAYLDLFIEAGEFDEYDPYDYIDEVIENCDQLCEWFQDGCEEAYGRDWSYDVVVYRPKELSKSDLRSFENRVNGEDTDFEVTEGLSVTVKITISGDGDDGTEKMTFEFYKVDGEWIITDFCLLK